jgi:signal transduction histidine kinase
MLALRRALLTLLALGIVSAGLVATVTIASRHEPDKALAVVAGVVIGLSFIGVGLFAWWRRPLNRFGVLMTGVGFAWFMASLTAANASAIFTIASYLGPLYIALVVHMVLAFPGGRLETTGQRAIVIAGYLLVVWSASRSSCSAATSPATWREHGRRTSSRSPTTRACGRLRLAGRLPGGGRPGRRGRDARAQAAPRDRAPAPQRAPMLYTALAVFGLVALAELLMLARADRGRRPRARGARGFAALPWAFLAGLVRSRYSRAGAVGELIERLNAGEAGGGSLRGALANALGDPSLQLLYWRPRAGQYVTHAGHPVELPAPARGGPSPRSSATASASAPSSTRSSSSTSPSSCGWSRARRRSRWRTSAWRPSCAPAWTSSERSRARVMEISLFERRRLERDLHDGAQQRLVALSVQIGMAQKMSGRTRRWPPLLERRARSCAARWPSCASWPRASTRRS